MVAPHHQVVDVDDEDRPVRVDEHTGPVLDDDPAVEPEVLAELLVPQRAALGMPVESEAHENDGTPEAWGPARGSVGEP